MITKKVYTLFLCLVISFSFAQDISRIETINIESEALNQTRKILIYTPPNYDEALITSYDVIYVFDAQNREFFDFVHSSVSFMSNATKRYIVVGIAATYIEEPEYARNNDLLPELTSKASIDIYGTYSGNAANYLKYVHTEVIPYIENNYRVKTKHMAIGHSLSASFILYAMFNQPGIFDAYFAISPNLAYNDEMLANAFVNYDFTNPNAPDFVYVSAANEGIEYWQPWKPAKEKVFNYIDNTTEDLKTTLVKREFPDKGHLTSFAPGFLEGYRVFLEDEPNHLTAWSKEEYAIRITVKVPKSSDEVYIVGNQESLGNWAPDKVKLTKVSDYEREIQLQLKSPAELKLTRGSWDSEAFIKDTYNTGNIWVNPSKTKTLHLEVEGWADDRY